MISIKTFLVLSLLLVSIRTFEEDKDDVPICGGFVEFDASINPDIKKQIDYSAIQVQSYNLDLILKDQTYLAQSGYYFLPIYENESFILKISGPNGMSFEPESYTFTIDPEKNIKLTCVGDINFKFAGFSVQGKVNSQGSDSGPEGVKLGLFDENEEKMLQETKTIEEGAFYFKPIVPGNYLIKPFETKYNFQKNFDSFRFSVNLNSSNYFEKVLIINGFHVTGKIEAENEPIENVLVFIYPLNSEPLENYECALQSKYNLENYKYKDLTPICLTISEKSGFFTFSNIPHGRFLVRPYYTDKYITYEIEPEAKEISVEHRDLVIKSKFQVTTFSIYGKVVNSIGNGIPNVVIKIDGQVKTVTDDEGVYKLERLSSGNYDLEAQAEDYFFEPLTNLRITAHLKFLPDVVVTHYKLCGKILIESVEYFSSVKRSVVLQDASDKTSKKEQRTITDLEGNYCFEVKSGKFLVYPVLSQEEKESDLHLHPEFREVDVIDRPFLEANFFQSKVVISGSINCIDQCDKDIQVELISLKNDKSFNSYLDEENKFLFNDILSGHYKIIIKKSEWCWEKEEIIIKVQNSNIENLEFKQSGFSMFFSSSHDVKILFTNTINNYSAVTILEREKNKICLPSKGTYTVQPISCQKFEKEFYHYNTNSTDSLNLIAQEFLVKGEITINPNLIKKIGGNLEDFIVLEIHEKSDDQPIISYKNIYREENSREYLYEFFAKSNSFLTIIPIISKEFENQAELKNLIFFPKKRDVVIEEDCVDDPQFLRFDTRSGLVINGSVYPPMENVVVKAFNSANNELVASTQTNSEGEYKIGPLYNEFSYDIKAFRDGYKIVKDTNNQYNFIAEKLSFLRVRVLDTNNKPLPSVFLSLSSSDRSFKINNVTNQEGYYDYNELYSGDYYVKPLYKEYRFEPAQKFIKVHSGMVYNETIIAHRVAFSIYGKIYNLNKEKVEGLYIQAYSNKTRQIQETSIDKNGEYRLRGLLPGQSYEIRAKIPTNSTIEKALPANIQIKIQSEDVLGLDFVVMQKPKKIDIRQYFNFTDETDSCPLSKINNYYVELSKIENGENVTLHTKNPNFACQTLFRNLEKEKYFIKIFEKIPKQNAPKLISERELDLTNDSDINGGVFILVSNVETVKKVFVDSLNYNIYSPIFLFLMVISLLKFDYTVLVINYSIQLPFEILNKLFVRRRRN